MNFGSGLRPMLVGNPVLEISARASLRERPVAFHTSITLTRSITGIASFSVAVPQIR